MSEQQPKQETASAEEKAAIDRIDRDVAVYEDVVRMPILIDSEVYDWFEELTPDYKYLMAAVLKQFMKGCKKTLRELNSHDIHVIMDHLSLD